MNKSDKDAIMGMYGDEEDSHNHGANAKGRPESSAYVDHCVGNQCQMTDDESDDVIRVPRGVAKRLDPEHFKNERH